MNDSVSIKLSVLEIKDKPYNIVTVNDLFAGLVENGKVDYRNDISESLKKDIDIFLEEIKKDLI